MDNILAAQGFEREDGAGGCVVLAKYLADGSYVWVTDQSGSNAPTWADWFVCAYPAGYDGEPVHTLPFSAYSDDHAGGYGLLAAVADAQSALGAGQ